MRGDYQQHLEETVTGVITRLLECSVRLSNNNHVIESIFLCEKMQSETRFH